MEDADKRVMIELGKLPDVQPLQKQIMHNFRFHTALKSENLDNEIDYLAENGAKFIEKCPVTRPGNNLAVLEDPGDNLAVLEDPWGNCIQSVKRKKGKI
ncbi:VOC family protein [Methanosarcina sp. T3]|uniref:VOC family protein n=1 Tax=Methanosarcina sp. T3 TaxID=3439062 RepID=UPI003F86B30D